MSIAEIERIASDTDLIMEKYQVKLIRFNESVLEIVRNWRNSPEISQYMLNKNYITAENQLNWFHTIKNSSKCFYFIIEYQQKMIGVCNIMDIDYEKKISNCGGYISDTRFLNSGIFFNAVMALGYFSFNILQLEAWITPVFKNNLRALRFNAFLGYKAYNDIDDKLAEYILTKDDFNETLQKNAFLLK